MKKFIIAFVLLLISASEILACAFDYKIEKKNLIELPIIAYIDLEESNSFLQFYFKSEGNFKGLSSVAIEMISETKEIIFRGKLHLSEFHLNKKLRTTGFSIRNQNISNAFLQIYAYEQHGTPETGIHSSIFIY